MAKILLPAAIAFILILSSCGKEPDKQVIKESEEKSISFDSVIAKKNVMLAKDSQAAEKSSRDTNKFVLQLNEKELSGLLPAVPGTKPMPYVNGKISEDNNYNTVFIEQNYKTDKKENVNIHISDFGNNPVIPFKDIYTQKPTDLGLTFVKLKVPGCIGNYYFTEAGKTGVLHILIHNRFGIEILVTASSKPEDLLKAFYNKLDFNKFEK